LILFRRLALVVAGLVVLAGAAAVVLWRGYEGPGPLTEPRAVVNPKP